MSAKYTREQTVKLLSPETVADILSVAISTVLRWLRAGELPGIHIGKGNLWRVRESDLIDWLEKPTPVETIRRPVKPSEAAAEQDSPPPEQPPVVDQRQEQLIDQPQAEEAHEESIANLIASLRGQGLSSGETAAELNRRGLRNSKGNPYSGGAIRNNKAWKAAK